MMLPMKLRTLIRALVECNYMDSDSDGESAVDGTGNISDEQWTAWVLRRVRITGDANPEPPSVKVEFHCSVFELTRHVNRQNRLISECLGGESGTGSSGASPSPSPVSPLTCEDLTKLCYQLMNYHTFNYANRRVASGSANASANANPGMQPPTNYAPTP